MLGTRIGGIGATNLELMREVLIQKFKALFFNTESFQPSSSSVDYGYVVVQFKLDICLWQASGNIVVKPNLIRTHCFVQRIILEKI